MSARILAFVPRVCVHWWISLRTGAICANCGATKPTKPNVVRFPKVA